MRRESILPAAVGLSGFGRRRTPGLRREEVALLAEIGVGWYSKLEMGHDVKASPATLLAITRVLRMNRSEAEYVFALADVAMPLVFSASQEGDIPQSIEYLVPNVAGVGVVLWDRYMTALRWNAVADGMFDYSSCPDPIDRNSIVRLHRDEFRMNYYGADYHDLLRSLVGIFRRAYMTDEPTEFARQVYEIASTSPTFRELWKEQLVAEELFHTKSGPFQRKHPVVGSYSVMATNMRIVGRDDLYLRVIAPSDEESEASFARLEQLGKASVRMPQHL